MGDGTAANGERVLKRESLEQMRAAQTAQAGHRRRHRALVAHPPGRRGPDLRAWRDARRPHPAARDRPRTQLRHRDPDEREHRMAADPGRRARSVEVVPRRDLRDEPGDRAPRTGRDAAVGRAARAATRSRAVPRHLHAAEQFLCRPQRGGKLFVQDRPGAGTGTARESPVAFYGPDRVVVTDGQDRGQSIEFVRDDSGRVNWIRVVGRVAVRTP